MWIDDWVGIPHVRRGRSKAGCDCLGLFILLHAERFGRAIPDPECSMAGAVHRRVAEAQRDIYKPVAFSDAAEGDAILIRAGGHPIHVAYCLGPDLMLHTEDEAGSIVERWQSSRWRPRVEGLFRYQDC